MVSVSMLTEGLGRQHRDPHPGHARLRDAASLRAGGGPRPAARAVTRSTTKGHFEPEYAEVYGVPFSFIPTDGSHDPRRLPPKPVTRVRALEERAALRDALPRACSATATICRREKLAATFTARFAPGSDHRRRAHRDGKRAHRRRKQFPYALPTCKRRREQEIDFVLARHLLETFFRDGEGDIKPWLFPELLRIVRRWRQGGWLVCQDDTFPQMVLFAERATDAAERSIARSWPRRPARRR